MPLTSNNSYQISNASFKLCTYLCETFNSHLGCNHAILYSNSKPLFCYWCCTPNMASIFCHIAMPFSISSKLTYNYSATVETIKCQAEIWLLVTYIFCLFVCLFVFLFVYSFVYLTLDNYPSLYFAQNPLYYEVSGVVDRLQELDYSVMAIIMGGRETIKLGYWIHMWL